MLATYKTITHSDIDSITAMMLEFYGIDGYPMDIEKSKNLFAEFLQNENLGKAWLIFLEDIIIGYIILTFVFSFEYGGKIAFVDELYLSENARGKGIGRSCIEFIKIEAAKLSLKLLYLEVEHHNSNAQQLYLSSGFASHNRKLMYYKIIN
jgi:GNAT superfamily N-acetyltransferase